LAGLGAGLWTKGLGVTFADIPDLRHCAAFGESPEEALAEVLRAKAVWMEAAKAEGKPVLPPSFIYQLPEVPA